MRFEKFKKIVEEHNPDMTVYSTDAFRNVTTRGCSVIYNKGTAQESKVYTYNGTYEDLCLRLVKNSTCNRIISLIKDEIKSTEMYEDIFGLMTANEVEEYKVEKLTELNNRLEVELAKEILF